MTKSDPAGPTTHPHVLIAGGGVAALEALLALRTLVGSELEVTLVAPQSDFIYKPLLVDEPFVGREKLKRWPLTQIADDLNARLYEDSVVEVIANDQAVRLSSGETLNYDALVIAIGVKPVPAFEHVLTFTAETARDQMRGLIADIEQGYTNSVAFIVPPQTTWSLPLYELALMTARQVWGMGVEGVEFMFITPEEAPLAVFGPDISVEVARLLKEDQIEFVGSSYVTAHDGVLTASPGDRTIDARRIVALPRLEPFALAGVPVDSNGFIAIDSFCRVKDLENVYAAGDATAFPIKQGGLATQQADTVAYLIANQAGVDITPTPFQPVLRGQLFTGDKDRFLRSHPSGGAGGGEVTKYPLWWPSGKIVGRYLTPYLSEGVEAHPLAESKPGYTTVELKLD